MKTTTHGKQMFTKIINNPYRVDFAENKNELTVIEADLLCDSKDDGYIIFENERMGYDLIVVIVSRGRVGAYEAEGDNWTPGYNEAAYYNEIGVTKVEILFHKTNEVAKVTDKYFINDIEEFLNNNSSLCQK